MKAMVLAAGLGTRLRPLTDTRPKALVEINGRTLLEITLSRLRSFGITEVILNVHHFAGMVVDYLKAKNNFDMRIEISREDDLLLDTGGGLKKAAWFFLEDSKRNAPSNLDEPFFLHNVDVISTIDLRRMLQFHIQHRALATLAVQSRESSRQLLFNDQLQLRGRRIAGEDTIIPAFRGVVPSEAGDHGMVSDSAEKTGSVIPSEARDHGMVSDSAEKTRSVIPSEARNQGNTSTPLQAFAFSGIHIISPRLLPMLTEKGAFSIINAYLRLPSQGEKILAFRADQYYWRDLGRPADLSQAATDLQQKTIL
jgi:NDP-sugar pyrophosphorylase family protein